MIFDRVVLKRASLIYAPVLNNSSLAPGTGFPPSALYEITRLRYLQEHDLDNCNCCKRACGYNVRFTFLGDAQHV